MAFAPKKHLIRVQGGREYLPVAYRLVWFRDDHPDWGVDTKPVVIYVDKGVAVFQANVFDAEGRLMACGTKMETARGFGDFVEKAETGSIGRALGVLGYGTQFAPEFDEGDRIVDSPQGSGNGQHTAAAAHGERSGGIPACEECGTVLTSGQAALSEKKFGRALCPSCQRAGAAA